MELNTIEIKRNLVHVFLGASVLLLLHFATLEFYSNGKIYVEAFLVSVFLVGSIIADQKMKGKKVPVVDTLIFYLERPNELMVGKGAFWFLLGILLSLSFLRYLHYIYASIFMLSFGDGLSAIVGSHSNTYLPWNKHKTWAGSITFFLIGCVTYFFIGWKALPLAVICSIIESTDLSLNDNLLIPLICWIFFYLF